MDIVKCVGDANIQCHYVGDGDGDISVAGLGLPPSALTDGSIPSAEILFKRSLHEVKGLLESKAYLRNPDSAEATAGCQEALVLEGKAERESSTKLLSKLVEKLCQDVDPMDLFTSRKHKLDEAWAALGEELYNLWLTQLKDEFLKSLAL
jgi:hypothetical protein